MGNSLWGKRKYMNMSHFEEMDEIAGRYEFTAGRDQMRKRILTLPGKTVVIADC
jgi:hypothetical protein